MHKLLTDSSLVIFLGGLFGSSTFSQPVPPATSSGFGFGTASGTSSSLFGNTNTAGSGLFSQPSNAFGATKPASFGSKYPFGLSLYFNTMYLHLSLLFIKLKLSYFTGLSGILVSFGFSWISFVEVMNIEASIIH